MKALQRVEKIVFSQKMKQLIDMAARTLRIATERAHWPCGRPIL